MDAVSRLIRNLTISTPEHGPSLVNESCTFCYNSCIVHSISPSADTDNMKLVILIIHLWMIFWFWPSKDFFRVNNPDFTLTSAFRKPFQRKIDRNIYPVHCRFQRDASCLWSRKYIAIRPTTTTAELSSFLPMRNTIFSSYEVIFPQSCEFKCWVFIVVFSLVS